MADVRLPAGGSSLPLTPRAAPPRSEAVRAAQRAFFDAALNGTASDTPAAPRPQGSAAMAAANPPGRPLRPGSLLDIKV